MLYGGHSRHIFVLHLDFIHFLVYYCFFFLSVFLKLKSMVFPLLKIPPLFEFLLFTLLRPDSHHPVPPPAPWVTLLCLSMPPRRESLDKVKTRLQIELQRRTDKRVSELLNPKPRESDIEIFDDSEEEDRLRSRQERAARSLSTQTSISPLCCCCGLVVLVLSVQFLCSCLLFFSWNGRRRLARKGRQAATKKPKTKRQDMWAPF